MAFDRLFEGHEPLPHRAGQLRRGSGADAARAGIQAAHKAPANNARRTIVPSRGGVSWRHGGSGRTASPSLASANAARSSSPAERSAASACRHAASDAGGGSNTLASAASVGVQASTASDAISRWASVVRSVGFRQERSVERALGVGEPPRASARHAELVPAGPVVPGPGHVRRPQPQRMVPSPHPLGRDRQRPEGETERDHLPHHHRDVRQQVEERERDRRPEARDQQVTVRRPELHRHQAEERDFPDSTTPASSGRRPAATASPGPPRTASAPRPRARPGAGPPAPRQSPPASSGRAAPRTPRGPTAAPRRAGSRAR